MAYFATFSGDFIYPEGEFQPCRHQHFNDFYMTRPEKQTKETDRTIKVISRYAESNEIDSDVNNMPNVHPVVLHIKHQGLLQFFLAPLMNA